MPQYRMTLNELQVFYTSPDVLILEAHLEQLKVLYGHAREAPVLSNDDYTHFLQVCIQEKQRLICHVLGLTSRATDARNNSGSKVRINFEELFRK